MIPLKQISVPTHCDEAWDGMAGDAQARFCESCSHHVHDLSQMSRAEAQALLDRTQGRLCVRYVPDANGAPLTREDLTITSPARRLPWPRRWAAAVSWVVAVLMTGAGVARAAVSVKHAPGKTTKPGHARPKPPPAKPPVAHPVPNTRPPGATMGIVALPPSPPHRMGEVAAPPKK